PPGLGRAVARAGGGPRARARLHARVPRHVQLPGRAALLRTLRLPDLRHPPGSPGWPHALLPVEEALTTGSRPPPRYRAGPLRWCWPWSASSCRGAVTSPDGPDGANAMLGSRTVLHAEMDPGGVANAGAGPADFDMGHATCPAGRGGGDEEEESC